MANTDDLIREAMRNGEDYLQTQMQIALAADQRAVSLGGILVAAAAVVLGFLFADTEKLTETTSYVLLLLSGGLGVASGLAFYAARPVSMRAIGNRPSNWYEDIEADKPIADAIKEEIYYIDKAIQENTFAIDRNATYFTAAMFIAALAVVAAVFMGGASTIFNYT